MRQLDNVQVDAVVRPPTPCASQMSSMLAEGVRVCRREHAGGGVMASAHAQRALAWLHQCSCSGLHGSNRVRGGRTACLQSARGCGRDCSPSSAASPDLPHTRLAAARMGVKIAPKVRFFVVGWLNEELHHSECSQNLLRPADFAGNRSGASMALVPNRWHHRRRSGGAVKCARPETQKVMTNL